MTAPGIINPPSSGGGGGSSTATGETLGANDPQLTLTISDDARPILFTFEAGANGSSNRIYATVNAETAETGYSSTYFYNGTFQTTSSNDSLLVPNLLSDTNRVQGNGIVSRNYDGSNTQITITLKTFSNAGRQDTIIRRTLSGDVALTALNIRSNQTDGLLSGSSIS